MADLKKKDINPNQMVNSTSTLTDDLPIGIYRTTMEGKILYANIALANMLEYSLEELHKMSVNELYTSDKDRDSKIKLLKTISSQELNLKTKSGKIITVKDTVKTVKNNKNKIVYFDGIIEDISEKKKSEEALKESEARYKTLTEITIEGIIMHKGGIIIDVNPSAQKMTGYSSDYVKGKNILDFIHPNSLDFIKSKLNTGYTGSFEATIICADKSSLEIEIEAKNVIVNGDENRVVAFRDITNKKKYEEEILALSTAVKQSPTSIVITNINGIIEYVNPKFTKVTGYEYDEAVGKNPRILKTDHTKSEDYKEMWETITKGKTWTGEFLNKRKDGTNYWELASISPIIDENGMTIKYIAVKEDITERKKTEDALIKSEKELLQANATKNVFFSIIAHDLKGPIGNFTQVLNLLKDNFNDISNDDKLDYIHILSRLSLKTNNLLDDLLLWAKIQMNTLEFSVETINLKSLVSHSIEIVEEKAKEKNIEIKTHIENINLQINESSVKTVIRNLLSNSIKFSNTNSIIKISSKISKDSKSIEISVQDNGVGIPAEDVDKLFKIESSFSTYGTEKEKGTGLGLILCKNLIEKNGGTIWVESKENVGSTFYFNLPLSK
jgi:PAS domain S-box-containing protein